MSEIRQWRRPPAMFRDRIPWTPHALPDGRNADGRPVWEPPLFEYSHLIGEEYDKQREAVLKHTNHDVVETTNFMDAAAEKGLLQIFRDWTAANANAAQPLNQDSAPTSADVCELEGFYDGLLKEVMFDLDDVHEEHTQFGFRLVKRNDNTYRVITSPNGDHRGRSSFTIDGEPKDEDIYRLYTPGAKESTGEQLSMGNPKAGAGAVPHRAMREKATNISNRNIVSAAEQRIKTIQPIITTRIGLRPRPPPALAFMAQYAQGIGAQNDTLETQSPSHSDGDVF